MNYRTKALEAYQQEQQEIAEENIKKQERAKNHIAEYLQEILQISDGITYTQIKSPDDPFDFIRARVEELPGVQFYVLHYFNGGNPELTMESLSPEVPSRWSVHTWADVGKGLYEIENKIVAKPTTPIQFEGYHAFYGSAAELARIMNSSEQIDLIKVLKYETDDSLGIYLLNKWKSS